MCNLRVPGGAALLHTSWLLQDGRSPHSAHSITWSTPSSQPFSFVCFYFFIIIIIFFSPEIICTALTSENSSLLENNLSSDYRCNAGSLRTAASACLCLLLPAHGAAGKEGPSCCGVGWRKAKLLVSDW